MKKMLIVDNHDSFVYNIVQLLREAPDAPAFEVVRNDCLDFGCLEDFGGIILSPGPGIPEEAGDLPALIDRCRESHPMFGVCLGHQAIACSFGASLHRLEQPLHGHLTLLQGIAADDPLLAELPERVTVGRYHSWVVEAATLPPSLAVTSVDEEGNIMSFRHRSLPLHGVQFHPESCISDCGRKIMENWLDICRQAFR